jgi:nucleoside 2-deoxyribosyltransferase
MATTVYLAGKMMGLTEEEMTSWRKEAEEYLTRHEIKVIDPVRAGMGLEEQTSRQIVAINKYLINRSDVVLAELNHKEVSIGTIGEIIFASSLGIPVFTWGSEIKVIYHPWVWEHITAAFETLEKALVNIRDWSKEGNK